MRLRRTTFVTLLAALLLSLLGPSLALAQSQSLYWERFDVDLTVEQENGALLVRETQVINFTSGVFTEGFAELDTTNTDGITDVTVSENGRTYDLVSSTSFVDEGEYAVGQLENGNLEVVWDMGRTRNETRTFEISYRVKGAIRRYPEGNEFQWHAISPDLHSFEIRESTVVVHMPAGVSITDFGYLGPPEFQGVAMELALSDDKATATYVAQAPLQPSQGVSLWTQFPPDTVGGGPPSWQAAFDARMLFENTVKPWLDVGLLALGLLILAGGPVLLYVLWYLRGRDPSIDAVPEYITAPPSDLTPGIAGTLVDERADVQDIIATVMDLGRRGYLVIEESGEDSANRLVSKQYTFRKTGKTGGLNDLETRLYAALFKGGRETVGMRDLNQSFYANIPTLQKALYDTAVTGGYFTASPEAVRSSYGCLGWVGILATFLAGCGAMAFFADLTATVLCPVMALAVVSIVLLFMGRHMPAKTRKGVEAAALSRAFKTYLTNLEKYADPKTVTDQFEKYLPFAIAFGLERSWINRFKQIPATPIPGWYYPAGRPYMGGIGGLPRAGQSTQSTLPTAGPSGAGGLGAPEVPNLQQMSDSLSGGLQGMSDGLNNMLNSAARTLTSTPPSSSGSSGGRSYSGRSGGSFSGRSSGGGGFRSSGGSGGGGRGFR